LDGKEEVLHPSRHLAGMINVEAILGDANNGCGGGSGGYDVNLQHSSDSSTESVASNNNNNNDNNDNVAHEETNYDASHFDITDSAVKYGYEGLLSLSSAITQSMCAMISETTHSSTTCEKPERPITDTLNVTLYQKKRGNGGVWQAIEENERIRVDKSKGKLLRLLVSSSSNNISEKGWDFTFQLNNSRHGTSAAQPGDGFTVDLWQMKQNNPDNKEFKIKLTRISRCQSFYVTASKDDAHLAGYSLTFRSDDNGKVYTSNKRQKLNTPGTSLTSPSIAKKKPSATQVY